MGFSALLRKLRRNASGSVAVEFAMLGSMFVAMLLAVFQIGIALQAYNAIRSASADVARYAAVQYQTDNRLTNTQLRNYAVAQATSNTYLLDPDNLNVRVQDEANQRIVGARQIRLTLDYRVPTILETFGLRSPNLTYTRPIFVVTS